MNEKDKKNYEFFEDLDILVRAFEYRLQEPEDDPSKIISLQEMLINGFMESKDVNSSSRELRLFKNNIDQAMTKYMQLFSMVFKRRMFVSFFREINGVIDLSPIEEDGDWISLRDNLVDSLGVSETEARVLKSVEYSAIIKELCNCLTHQNEYKFVNTPKVNIPSYNLLSQPGRAALTEEAFRLMNEDITIEVPFRSFRLGKTFNFVLNEEKINIIVDLFTKRINSQYGFNIIYDNFTKYNWEEDINKSLKLVISKTGESPTPYIFDEHEISAIKSIKAYFDDGEEAFNELSDHEKIQHNIAISHYALALCSDTLIHKQLVSFETFHDCSLIAKTLFQHALTNSQLKKHPLTRNIGISQPEIYPFEAINDLINVRIKHIGDRRNYNGSSTLIKMVTQYITAYTLISLSDPKQLYIELLLTEIQNQLEYLDSKQSESHELYKDVVDSYENFDDISLTDFNSLATIRNSLIHLRYIKDNDNIYFYDGLSDNISYKFTLDIDKLSTIRNCLGDYIKEYIQSLETQTDQERDSNN